MNRPLRISLVCSWVIVAALGGFSLGRVWQHDDSGAKSVVASIDTTRKVEQLQVENQRLQAENTSLAKAKTELAASAKESPSSAASTLQQLGILAAAQKEKTITVRLPVVGRDGNLAAGFAKLFGLSDAEQQTLQGALNHARQQIDQLSASTTTAKRDGNTLVVAVSPFDGGSDVYDGLMEAFAQTLGTERNAAFVTLQGDQLSGAFNAFGAEQRTMTVSLEAGLDGAPKIAVRDQRKAPNSSMVNVSQVATAAELAQRYPALAPYVDQVSSLPVQSRPTGPPRPDIIRP